MDYTGILLNTVDLYCEQTGRARSGVAKEILNDSKFFDRIEGGAGFTMRTYEKVMAWLKEHTPPLPSPETNSNARGTG